MPEFPNNAVSDFSGTCWPSTIMCTAANMELLLVMIRLVTDNNYSITTFGLGKASKKNQFFLGKSPKLWVGGGQES